MHTCSTRLYSVVLKKIFFLRENRSRIEHDYATGDKVYVIVKDIQRKLSPVKQGPFTIVKIHTNGTVTIRRSPRVTERINIRRLHPAHPN